MLRIFSYALTILALTAVGAVGADNSLGTWKLSIESSSYIPAPFPVKSLTVMREEAPGGVKVTVTGERADGTPINASYTAKYDGSWAAVSGTGTPYDSIAIKQVNDHEFTYLAKQTNGPYRASGRIEVAKDGKRLTQSAKGKDATGKAMQITLIYDKK